MTWTSADLEKIGAEEEIELATRRHDGALQKPVTVWIVRHGDGLYVRSVNGATDAWYRGAQERHEGRFEGAGVEKDVAFLDADSGVNEQIDAAYRTKYRRYAGKVLDSILTPKARAATLKVVPRA
ncbi:MAG TPA: DUF2255 family protein [bacterium]|nr:DUF2255 family protein [bacterium]